MTCTEPISSTAEAWSPNLPITHITGVYAGAGVAAPYHRRAHAVRDAQVPLWEGEQPPGIPPDIPSIQDRHVNMHACTYARACSNLLHNDTPVPAY